MESILNQNSLENITLLIAEDSDTDRNILVNTLKKYFKNIIEASNGLEAYDLYNKYINEIDIIVSDITMPKLDGIELLKRIRLKDLNLPFIFTTAKLEIDSVLEAINLNANYYIIKPIKITDLLQKIDLLCEKLFFQKRLEEKQKEIENYIEAVDSVALIFKMLEDGQITYMNKSMQEISGYDEKDLQELNFNNIIHPSIPKKIIEDTWSLLREDKLFKGDTKFLSKNQETFYLNNTVFKIKSFQKDEYITIAFLTTQENLKKRDFHRKVLLSIQEANRKEAEYKSIIKDLQKQLNNENNFIANCSLQLENEKQKAIAKERQLTHYELQMEKNNEKNEKILNSKNEEIQSHIKKLEIVKRKHDLLFEENLELKEEVKGLKEKYLYSQEEIISKNKKINDLIDLINNIKNK
jgi:PAS domain S-box-containing protein